MTFQSSQSTEQDYRIDNNNLSFTYVSLPDIDPVWNVSEMVLSKLPVDASPKYKLQSIQLKPGNVWYVKN